MPLLAVVLALLTALVLPAAAGAAPRASVRVTDCTASLAAAERSMVAEGRMATVRAAARLQIRFDLQVRTPARPRFVALRAAGFGVWNTADPAPRRYVYAKRVENLTAPAGYRMLVRFRWLDARGHRLASARRVSRVCEQPDLRPDLVPLRVAVAPGPDAGTRRYVVPVRNTGPTQAGPFAVALSIGGRVLAPHTLAGGLAPGAGGVVAWTGPACAARAPIAVRVDGDGAVDESDEADNVLLRACPG